MRRKCPTSNRRDREAGGEDPGAWRGASLYGDANQPTQAQERVGPRGAAGEAAGGGAGAAFECAPRLLQVAAGGAAAPGGAPKLRVRARGAGEADRAGDGGGCHPTERGHPPLQCGGGAEVGAAASGQRKGRAQGLGPRAADQVRVPAEERSAPDLSRDSTHGDFSDDAYAALQQDMQRASQVQREGTEDQLDDTDESEAEAGKESQKEMELPDAALEAAKKENEHLRARCDQLEGLLREHAIQLTTLPMQQDQEAALPLLRQAEALDCALLTSPKIRAAQALDCAESPKRALLTQVRVCNCGNLLMEDALFCRKCGGRWRGTEAKAELAGDITELQDQILQAEKVLRDSVEPKLPVAAERMSTASFILRPNGGWTDTGSNEDEMELEQSIKLMQLRKNVEELKSQKLQAEARLLTQRCGDLATAEVMDLTPSETDEEIFGSERPDTVPLYGCDGVNCEYRRRLKAQGALIGALRGLCSQLGEKLQEATGEHLEMSLALSAMQGSLEGAVEAVESCKKQPKEDLNRTLTQLSASLQESKRRSVFWRLYQNSSRRRRPGADKRLELLKKTYEHLYKIDAVSGRDANPQSPSRRHPPRSSPLPWLRSERCCRSSQSLRAKRPRRGIPRPQRPGTPFRW
ncbi:unnamed protein product [Effrenium voratum]|nr:unnamed protein product [Effrenium voratum]